MRRLSALILLGVLSVGGGTLAFGNTGSSQSRADRKAVKKQQKAQKKYAKAQRKAQQKMIKKDRKNSKMFPQHR
jgi:uncharacterized protein HemX